MATRLQIVLDEVDAQRFRSQAKRESKSLSAWFREVGLRTLEETKKTKNLKTRSNLKAFFTSCDAGEQGLEPNWDEHKDLILQSATSGRRR